MEDIFGAYEFALKHQWNAFLVFDRDSCSLIYSSENVPHLLPALEGETATTLADLKSTWPESENPAFWQAIANPDPASLPQTLYPGDRTGVDAGIPVLVLPLPGPHHRSIVGFPAVAPLPQTGNWNKGTLDAKGVFDYDGTPLYLDPSWRQEIFSIARNGDNGGEFDWVCREDLAIFRSNWEVVCWGDGSPRIWKSRLHNSSYGHFWAEIKAHADEGAKKVFLTLRNINAAEEHFQALRRIEGKHRAMLDAMPDLFLYLDSSGHFIDIQLPTNGDDFPFNGEILGKTIRDVFPPGVAEKFMQGLREVTQNTAISVFNFSLGEAEKIRYFEARITLSTTLDFLIVLRETTHRVQSQRILNLTKYSVDHAADLILWMNGDGNIIYANETALRTLGFSAKDLYTRQYFDLDPDFDPADWKKTWEGLQNGPARKFLTLFRSADNHAFEVEVSLNHISLEGQEMLCAFASAVGERRTLSAEVRKMKLALQSVSNSVMLLDREDRVQWVNRAYELLWGTPLDQIVGLDSLQFVDKFLKTNREIKNPRDP
ncbi:MAG TPA: PAS domain-containing protein, partial [Calditrichia bacterium]|nr:PAS domain-containing protein [Calditrichia bacterium]